MWHLDSGCSRHMSGDRSQFVSLKSKKNGYVTFGDNNKGKIIGIGKVGNNLFLLLKMFYWLKV